MLSNVVKFSNILMRKKFTRAFTMARCLGVGHNDGNGDEISQFSNQIVVFAAGSLSFAFSVCPLELIDTPIEMGK